MLFKTKGMNQDLSVSAFNPEFAFENRNLKLSTNEGNTQLSWVNEKGTLWLDIDDLKKYDGTAISNKDIQGAPLGTAVLNQKLVIFTHSFDNTDRIYMFEYSDADKTKLSGTLLYEGLLNFNLEYPLETLVRYEDDSIQKVYWTDGLNQPRMINIAAPVSTMTKWNVQDPNHYTNTLFDFIPALTTWGDMAVEKMASGGLFAPGVIQYCFTYINNYGQQSNIIQVSPLLYIAFSDRGASPEEKVSNSFKVTLNNLDTNFDCVKLYSIQRTSLNSDVIVREVDTLPIIPTSYTDPHMIFTYAEEGEYEGIALPYVYRPTSKRVVTSVLENGTYHNNIVPADTSYIPSGFVGDSNVLFTQQPGSDEILSFADFVNVFRSNFIHTNYFSYLKFTSDLAISVTGYKQWNSLYFKVGSYTNIQYALYNKYFVYDYETELWYITNEIPTTDVTTEEVVTSEPIVIVDNGTTGSSIDPYELLFVGGKEISALTMAEKDGTLFMGNVEQKNYSVSSIQKYFNRIRNTIEKVDIQFTNEDGSKQITLDIPSSHYGYNSMLGKSMQDVTSFKGKETYRFGFQLQRHTGEWSEPIFISDEYNDLYPRVGGIEENKVNLVCAKATISLDKLKTAIGEDLFSSYSRIRPLVVYPTVNDRSVLCQGVLNPTMFNVEDRVTNTPFAQSSWYFRPYLQNEAASAPSGSYNYNIKPYHTTDPEMGYNDCTDTNFDADDRTGVSIMLVQLTDGTSMYASAQTITGTQTSYYNDGSSPYSITRTFRVVTSYNLGGNLFALVSKDMWEEAGSTSYTPTGGHSVIRIDFTYNNFNTNQIKGYYWGSSVYKRLVESTSFPAYYIKPSDTAPNNARIMFYINGVHYTIHYPYINGSSHIYTASNGTNIKYKHYATLFDDENGDTSAEASHKFDSVEIQGSKNKYLTVEGGTAQTESNTQFFIDQSIVTFHSPDIEFDTDVQTFGGEGMALRIIGIVPITGSASAHKITHSALQPYSPNNSNIFGKGELPYNIFQGNINLNASKRLVTGKMWHDSALRYTDDQYKTVDLAYYYIYPWQKQGSLNNDWRKDDEVSSLLKTKKESTILYSFKSEYVTDETIPVYTNTDIKMCLWENEQVYNVRLGKQREDDTDINYYPNIDKVLTNSDGYVLHFAISDPEEGDLNRKYYNPISMKYKSGSHAVIALKANQGSSIIPVLPYALHADEDKIGNIDTTEHNIFWKTDTTIRNSQKELDIRNFSSKDCSFLLLGEIYRPDSDILNRFGGDSEAAIKNNKWQIAGDIVNLIGDASDNIELKWTYGDTFYQRYDCLKTYASTNEDNNQLIEVLSFMCETHVNADGRYDKNRGQIDNTVMSPHNFNLWNPVYSQSDNYFTYRISNTDVQKNNRYPNQVVWSKTKNSGSDIDIWTNVTLANTLELDGDKGEIRKLIRFNDQLLSFQDTGISQILYNENVQISSSQGVPIEIANSGKVDGKRYLSNTVGCSNKWSVVQTPAGIYFMDSNEKAIYRIGEGLQNISQQFGFNSWCKQHIPSIGVKWTPDVFDNFIAYYDKLNQDVLWINKSEALAYSEKFGLFTSFYDYGSIPYLCSLDDTGVWIDNAGGLWKHQAGDYCNFFDSLKDYGMTLIGNPEPLTDKIFTNLEFRACVEGDGESDDETGKFTPTLPFDFLETWDEYQHGVAYLSNLSGHAAMRHHTSDDVASLKRKFRIWRCDIPRDNVIISVPETATKTEKAKAAMNKERDNVLGISRVKQHPVDRMRNPWLYLKLQKDSETDKKVEIHDVVMTYFT